MSGKTFHVGAFERINFGYDPPLRQTADVLLVTDIPYDDGHLVEFEEAMWKAMWEQNPHWKDCKGPLPEHSGWSSVLRRDEKTVVLVRPIQKKKRVDK